MAALGLALDPAALGNLQEAPLGAVVSLGGCSASFVSSTGLVITNHHCVVDALQQNSSAEENLVRDGFIADGLEGERWSGPGSRIYVTDRVEDVTEDIRGVVASAGDDDEAAWRAWDLRVKELVAACEAPGSVRCSVVSFWGGQGWRLIRRMEIRDVRLVYAPPEMVGNYGDEIDNWMWPRHSGDFAFLRAWVGPDGMPADHDAANVPYRPAHWLPLASSPLEAGDFVMVAGYPGSTQRWQLAERFAFAESVSYPAQVDLAGEMLSILEARAAEDAEAAVRVGSLMFGLANLKKNNEGMLDGFRTSAVAARALQRQEEVLSWLGAQGREGGWSEVLSDVEHWRAGVEAALAQEAQERLLGWMSWGVRLLSAASDLYFLAQERALEVDFDREAGWQERDWPQRLERLNRVERSYDAEADARLLGMFLRRASQLPEGQRIAALDALGNGDEGAAPWGAVAEELYAATTLTDAEVRLQMQQWTVAEFEASEDPLIRLAVALNPLRREVLGRSRARQGMGLRLAPSWGRALQAVTEGEAYPDANSTLRVTFGQVQGYPTSDGGMHAPFTTVDGIAAKHTGEHPFDAPAALLAAIPAWGSSGPWVAEDLGQVPVCFLSDVDTTGGNSGSATLNARGELVGLLFDGNYEAMASDWLFDPVMTRSIHVDLRYVLWLVSLVFPSPGLLSELGVDAG
jgi:hypothetical protein